MHKFLRSSYRAAALHRRCAEARPRRGPPRRAEPPLFRNARCEIRFLTPPGAGLFVSLSVSPEALQRGDQEILLIRRGAFTIVGESLGGFHPSGANGSSTSVVVFPQPSHTRSPPVCRILFTRWMLPLFLLFFSIFWGDKHTSGSALLNLVHSSCSKTRRDFAAGVKKDVVLERIELQNQLQKRVAWSCARRATGFERGGPAATASAFLNSCYLRIVGQNSSRAALLASLRPRLLSEVQTVTHSIQRCEM